MMGLAEGNNDCARARGHQFGSRGVIKNNERPINERKETIIP